MHGGYIERSGGRGIKSATCLSTLLQHPLRLAFVLYGFFIFFLMKKQILLITLLSFLSISAYAQELIDGKWWDNDLEFRVIEDSYFVNGEIEICIYHKTKEICVENLVTGFEVRIYNAKGEEVWNSLWTGKNKRIKFQKKIRDAHTIVIKANGPLVINILSGNRIYQETPMQLTYKLEPRR